MPTGYTHTILKGATFEQFVWNCARGMGAFIMQRDDAADAPPEMNEQPSPYHVDRLAEANDRLATLRARTDDEWLSEYQLFVTKTTAENKRRADDQADERAKYEAMLKRVEEWDVPSPEHVGLKKFMVEQIEESIRFDCGHPPYREEIPDFEVWKKATLERAAHDIGYHAKQLAEEQQRANDRNRWKAQLAASVPLPVAPALA